MWARSLISSLLCSQFSWGVSSLQWVHLCDIKQPPTSFSRTFLILKVSLHPGEPSSQQGFHVRPVSEILLMLLLAFILSTAENPPICLTGTAIYWGRLKAWRTWGPARIATLLWYLPVSNRSQAKPDFALRAKGSLEKFSYTPTAAFQVSMLRQHLLSWFCNTAQPGNAVKLLLSGIEEQHYPPP